MRPLNWSVSKRRHTNTLHPHLPAAFHQILQEMRRAFGYPLAGSVG